MTDPLQQTNEVLQPSPIPLRSHAEEVIPFHRSAVERELRTIELEKEVNELCRRHGEAERYPFAFSQVAKPTEAEPAIVPPRDSLVPLESVLCTEELNWRPARLPDYEAENRALVALAQALADSPRTILQTLTDTILEVVEADSAGLSLLADDEKSFFWPAISGMWQPYIGGGTPRDFGPCGDVLDCNAPQLFKHVERRYPYLLAATPPVEECLLVPFYWEGKAVGTIWAIAHDDRRKFDAEDLRLLESLGRFASAAYRAVASTEDAVRSRRAMETLNEDLRAGEDRYRVLFESVPIAVFVCDREAVIQHYNRRAVELWGREPACGVEQHCGSTKLWQPDGSLLPHPQSPVVEVLRTGVPVHHVEVFIERPDGSRLPVLVNFAALKNVRGEITGAITSFVDITERKQAEEALRTSEERFRGMIDALPATVYTTDAEGCLTHFNPAAVECSGRTPELGTDRWCVSWKLFRPDGTPLPHEECSMAIALKVGHAIRGEEIIIERPDRTRRWVEPYPTPLRDADGRVVAGINMLVDITERRKAEDALRASQSRLRHAANAAGLTYVEMDLASGGARTAENFAAVMGYAPPPEQETDVSVGSRHLIEHVVPDDRPSVEAALRDFTAGQRVGKIEYRVLGDDRIERHIESEWFIESAPNGQPLKSFATNLDVTERRRAEQKFRGLLESAPDAMIIIDGEGRISLINAQTEKLFGYARVELIGKPIEVLIPQRFHDHHPGHRHRFLDDPKLRPMGAGRELWASRQDGTEFQVEISLSPLETEAGILVTAAIRDITDRKQTEEALRESQRFLRSSLDALSGHIAVLDEFGIILEVNETWRRFADDNQFAAADYGVGASYIQECDLILPKGSETSAYLEGIHDVIAGRQNRFELEYPCHSPTEQRWYMMRVTRFQSPGPIRIVIVHDTITERKQAEQKMQEQAEALADLHRRKDEFLAMLSHELRNPLAPLSNAVHLLRQQKKEDPLLQQACNVIERQVGQLKYLVDDLLEISRINTGRIQLRPERIVVSGIVERAVETVHPLIVQRRHELAVLLPPQPIWLHADAARLEQVVVNLLTNAAKYTDEGGRIWLTVRQEGGSAVLSVRDTGVGIAPDLLPRVFDLFTQAERSLDRSQGGLGIGLALVQRLVEMHRGRVEVRSVLEEGSEFVVYLPVELAPAPTATIAIHSTEPSVAALRVLVVDDNVDAAETIAMLLQAYGHDVRTVFDGPTGLEAVLDYRPDVVLLDLGLPGLNGLEVAKRIRQQPTLENIVLVAVTGYGQESDRQRSLEAGFDHHLVKPADFGKLQKILATIPKKANATPATRASSSAN